MRNREKALYLIKQIEQLADLQCRDDLMGDCGETAAGWLLCQRTMVRNMLTDLTVLITDEEDDF